MTFAAGGNGQIIDHPAKDKVQGRKDASGQEMLIDSGVIKERIDDLVEAYLKVVTARDHLNEQIKSAATDSGLLSAVVRKFVVTRAQQTLPAEQRKADQLCLLFYDVGAE